MANELFRQGDRVRMKDKITTKENSRAEDVRDQILQVVNYTNNMVEPKMLSCMIVNGQKGHFGFAEDQLEKI